MYNEVTFYLENSLTRVEQRESLISLFLTEQPGTGRGDNASRYRYNVERYNEYTIYLRRPTSLNKGFDFVVYIENVFFINRRRYSNPSHNDIINALSYCKETYHDAYPTIMDIISNIYNCNDYDLNMIQDVYFIDGNNHTHPIQIILLAIKWLFIEQDCAYWNYSGRAMLFQGLQEHNLV